jgi:hypothetical protein
MKLPGHTYGGFVHAISEWGMTLIVPASSSQNEPQIQFQAPDGGILEHRCDRLWSEGKTLTLAEFSE